MSTPDAIRTALATVRSALEELPAKCRYHSDRIEPTVPPGWGREACCDTGLPSLRRRRAEAALAGLEAVLNSESETAPEGIGGGHQ